LKFCAILDVILNNGNYEKCLKKYIQKYENYKLEWTPYFKSSFSPNLIKWYKGPNEGKSKGNGAMMCISPIGYLKVIFLGGDTNTNACIVGSMAESLYGIDKNSILSAKEKIPTEFINTLEKDYSKIKKAHY